MSEKNPVIFHVNIAYLGQWHHSPPSKISLRKTFLPLFKNVCKILFWGQYHVPCHIPINLLHIVSTATLALKNLGITGGKNLSRNLPSLDGRFLDNVMFF